MFKSFQVILQLTKTSLQPGKERHLFQYCQYCRYYRQWMLPLNHILLNQEQEMVQLMHNFLSGEIRILQDIEHLV